MNERQIREGLESGRLHPFPLLQHLSNEGDEEGARLVSEIGHGYVNGRDRLRFRSLVRELAPGTLETEDSERARRSQEKHEERVSALGDALKAKTAYAREKREGQPVSSGGGWNLPTRDGS